MADQTATVDHRSNASRGIESLPTIKLGRGSRKRSRQAINQEIRQSNTTLRELKKKRAQLHSKNIYQRSLVRFKTSGMEEIMRNELAKEVCEKIDKTMRQGLTLAELRGALAIHQVELIEDCADRLDFVIEGERIQDIRLGARYTRQALVERGLSLGVIQPPSKANLLVQSMATPPKAESQKDPLSRELHLITEAFTGLSTSLCNAIATLVNVILKFFCVQYQITMLASGTSIIEGCGSGPTVAIEQSFDVVQKIRLAITNGDNLPQVPPAAQIACDNAHVWLAHGKLLNTNDARSIRKKLSQLEFQRDAFFSHEKSSTVWIPRDATDKTRSAVEWVQGLLEDEYAAVQHAARAEVALENVIKSAHDVSPWNFAKSVRGMNTQMKAQATFDDAAKRRSFAQHRTKAAMQDSRWELVRSLKESQDKERESNRRDLTIQLRDLAAQLKLLETRAKDVERERIRQDLLRERPSILEEQAEHIREVK
jgi:hypothetical protein